ncbi:hypothetical protein LDENG_00172590 [Lucifuga dentata]|nr:hypothetical protein LDENG_00172590 [Lucifuga dentata]
MKALQKNQGRTDQMLGAMADVLTSMVMPNQQWLSEGGEADLPSSEEEKGPVQGQWDPGELDWEQGAAENLELRERTGKTWRSCSEGDRLFHDHKPAVLIQTLASPDHRSS